MTRRNTEAVRRWRARQAGLAPQLQRCSCGRTATGAHAPMCSRCYWDSPAGRAEKVERRRKARREQRVDVLTRKGYIGLASPHLDK